MSWYDPSTWSGRDFDPTVSPAAAAALGPMGAGLYMGKKGLGSSGPNYNYPANPRAEELNALGKDIGGKFNQIGQGIDPFTGKPYDPNDTSSAAGRAYAEAKAPIESSYYNQGHNVSSYLARQGLGSSGINIGASQQLANNKEALEGQAKLKSIDLASAQSTQSLLNNLSSQLMGFQPSLALFMQQQQLNSQLAALKSQQDAAMMGGLGQGAGTLAGLGLGALMFA